MIDLHEVFEREILNLVKPSRLGTELVRKKLSKLGIKVNKSQINDIKRQFENIGSGTFHIEISDRQILDAGYKSEEAFKQKITNFVEELCADIESYSNKLNEEMPEIIMNTTDQLSLELLDDLKKRLKKLIKDRAKDKRIFETKLINDYREGFDLLEMLIQIAMEAGGSYNNELRSEASIKDNYLVEALTRLHARACQISYEIMVLLKSGLADGAIARWRTLHELSVITFIISENGQELAERYILHNGVESYKAAKLYQEQYASLGFEPLSVAELGHLQEQYDSLIDRFGKNYRSDYGWASTVTSKSKPTFRDLERYAGLEHLRSFYKMACINVHANPRGIFFKLGLYPESGDILLTGPSNVGLTDPGQLTALSLAQISTTLLNQEPNIDRIVACKIMSLLKREIGLAFSEAERVIHRNGVAAIANETDLH